MDTPTENVTEMDILSLEDSINQDSAVPSDDSLGRFRLLAPCSEGCVYCSCNPSGEEDVCREAVDWVDVADMVDEPRWVFDGRNVVDPLELQGLGFRVRSIGR